MDLYMERSVRKIGGEQSREKVKFMSVIHYN